METLEYRGLYTSLDTLLDTRFATLQVLFPKVAEEAKKTLNYLTRKTQFFEVGKELFSMDMIEFWYRYRHPNILKLAPPTNAVHLCAKMLMDYRDNADTKNPTNRFKIFVNTFPYLLSNVDRVILTGKFNGMIPEMPDFEMIAVHEDEVTFDMFKEMNVQDVVLYDGLKWLSKAMKQSTICSDGSIMNFRFVTNKPKAVLSKCNAILRDMKYPIDVDELNEQMRYMIPTYFMEELMFSYISPEIDAMIQEEKKKATM